MRFKLNKRVVIFQVPPYKRRLVSSLITIGVLVLTILLSIWVVDCRIRPSLSELARARAKQIAVDAINNAVESQIVPELKYEELILLKLGQDGRVSYMQPNIAAINRISARATLAVQQQLTNLPQEKVKIPLGQIFGFKLLASLGPVLPVKVFPFGIVEGAVKNHFEAAGINQVRHQVYIRIKTTVKMVVPLIREDIQVSSDIPLAEAVIVGEVPGLFLGTNIGELPGN